MEKSSRSCPRPLVESPEREWILLSEYYLQFSELTYALDRIGSKLVRIMEGAIWNEGMLTTYRPFPRC